MKIFFATYIEDVNPSSGDVANYLEARLLRDEYGNVIYANDWEKMLDLCDDDAWRIVNNDNRAEEHGYHIIKIENGCAVIDDEDFRICTYNIHELDLDIKVAFEVK